MKIYGIYEGCLYEGGGVGDNFYKNKEDAIEEAEKTVAAKNKEVDRMIELHGSKDSKFVIHGENAWSDGIDLISVIERDLI